MRDYLNPFQPFVERERDGPGEWRRAIENNMSRSVLSALANAEEPLALGMFLQELAQHAGSRDLRTRVEAFAAALGRVDLGKVEFDLQSWPSESALREPANRIILIGIASSHEKEWTYKERAAPGRPCADGWIHVPGEMLLVFEFKSDDHPLDATQISDYVHALRLLSVGGAPRAAPGCSLASPAEARDVQAACMDLVLDVPWSAVVQALEHIQKHDAVGSLGRWLSGQAAAYLHLHLRPRYGGPQTILDWLRHLDTPDRRDHLRTLIEKMGQALSDSAQESGAITFAEDDAGNSRVPPGAGAAMYVTLSQGGKRVQRPWLGKDAPLVLWFQFHEDAAQRIGLEFYMQAPGGQPLLRKDRDPIVEWNKASDTHRKRAVQFEVAMAQWTANAPSGSKLDVRCVRLRGKALIFQGAGIDAPDGPSLEFATPQDALRFLQDNREAMWRFPRVGLGEEFDTVKNAQPLVRKPALALRAILDIGALAACREDGQKLQSVLMDAVARITANTSY